MASISFKPKQTTKKLLKSLKDRAQEVVTRRYGLGDDAQRHTLQSIGDTYSITRERVRQIENAALKAIRSSETYSEAQHVVDELRDAMHSLGGLVEEKHFLETISSDPVTQNHIHLYLVLGDDFKKHKESKTFKARWSIDEVVSERIHQILESIHDVIDEAQLLDESEMISHFMNHGEVNALPNDHVHPEGALRWLKMSNTLDQNALGHWGRASSPHIKTRGIRDLAYLVMREHGSPLHFREVATIISERFGRPTHTATCHNELIKDERFVLVGRGVYGLAQWGYRSGTAREIIKTILTEEGRPMSREEIVERVMQERFLKKNTILVNLQNPKYFKKTEDGLYTTLA